MARRWSVTSSQRTVSTRASLLARATCGPTPAKWGTRPARHDGSETLGAVVALEPSTGKVLVMAPSVGGAKEVTDYIQLFDYDVNLLAAGLKQVTGK